MKSTVVDESLSSFKPMYCSREYQASTRLIQQYEKSTLNQYRDLLHGLKLNNPGDNYDLMVLEWFFTVFDHNLLFLHGEIVFTYCKF